MDQIQILYEFDPINFTCLQGDSYFGLYLMTMSSSLFFLNVDIEVAIAITVINLLETTEVTPGYINV